MYEIYNHKTGDTMGRSFPTKREAQRFIKRMQYGSPGLKLHWRPRKVKNPNRDKYEVIVGNIGSVHSGRDLKKALRVFNEYAEQSQGNYGRAAGEDVTLMRDGEPYKQYYGHQVNPSAIKAQVRRLPSGDVQIKIPLTRNPASLKEAMKAVRKLGRRVKAAVVIGPKGNPDKAYWKYPWAVVVDSGSVGITEALSRGFNTEKQAKAYIQKLKARSLHLGRAIQLLHNTGTNAPGGVKVVSSKSY